MAQVHTLATLSLPRSLVWVDEFQWTAPLRAQEYSITGALIVDVATRQAGRPITLQGFDDGGNRYVAPMTLAQLNALRALEEVAGGADMTLALLGSGETTRTFTVRFRRTDGPAIEARPIKYQIPAEAGDWFLVTLRLIQV